MSDGGSGRRYGLDLAAAWTKAKRRIKEASGRDLDAEVRSVRDPVQRARKMAETSAPADMRASLALSLGATPAELELDKSGARLILEAAHKRLGIVGLRAGESIEHDVSDRMRDFMERFYATPSQRRTRALDEGRVLEPEPDA